MAITAGTRSAIIELVVTALDSAPSAALLTELVGIIDDGGSLADVAAELTSNSIFTSRYPAFQTPAEFGAELLERLVPEASADAVAEGISVIESVLNGGGTRADVILQASAFLAALSESDANFGTSAARFNNKAAAAEAFTVTNELGDSTEAELAAAIASVTSDDDTLTAATEAFAAGYKTAAAKAEADEAEEAAAAAEAEDVEASDEAEAAALAAYEDAVEAVEAAETAVEAIEDVDTAEAAVTSATAAQAAVATAATAIAAFATAATETDDDADDTLSATWTELAEGLETRADAAKSDADAAVVSETEAAEAAAAEAADVEAYEAALEDAEAAIAEAEAADEALTEAQAALEEAQATADETDADALETALEEATTANTDAQEALEAADEALADAIDSGVVDDINTANAQQLIAAAAATAAATALEEAQAAYDEAAAADEAAAEASDAVDAAVEDAVAKAAAANTAAAAAATAAEATDSTEDDDAAAALVTSAAATGGDAADVEATQAATAAATAAEEAVAASATANADAQTAVDAIVSDATAAAAVEAADAAVEAAAAAVTAVEAYVAAAAETESEDDDAAAEALATTADTQSTTADSLSDTADAAALVDRSAQNLILTANADIATGGAGDDTISGTAGTVDGDVITAGAGSDTMSVTVTIADDDNSAFSATGLENLRIRSTGGTAGDAALIDLEMADVLGLETVTFRRLNDDVSLSNLQSLDTTIVVENVATTASVTVGYDASIVSGTSDSVALTVDTSTGGSDIDINGVETVTLTAIGEDNDVNVDGTSLSTLNIVGAGDISVDIDASVTTFNAADATGDVTMIATAGAALTATGGSGADTFSMGTTLGSTDEIDGGDGDDTLLVTGAAGAAIPTSADVTNVETLRIETPAAGGGVATTLDANRIAIDNITFDTSNAGDSFTVTDLTDEVLTVTESAGDTLALLNVSLDDATGTADAVTVNVRNADATTAFTISDINSAEGGIERLNLVATQVRDIALASDIIFGDISSTHSSGVFISGTADVTIGSGVALSNAILNTTELTGDLTAVIGTATSRITLGNGTNSVTFGAGAFTSADRVTGGTGSDTVITGNLAAGTAAPTISNVEIFNVDFGTAGATLSGVNIDGMTSLIVNQVSDEAVVLTALDAEVSTVQLGATAGGAVGDAATIGYAAGSNAEHTVIIGDSTATPAADVDTGIVTITGNSGALTIRSDEFTGNSIYDLVANAATSLTISTVEDLEVDDAGAGNGTISATAALSAILTTAGGDLVVDGATDLRNATSITYTGADGNITQTGAVTATDMETLTITAAAGVTVTQTGALTSDADVSSVSMTATGANADISFDGLLDVDHVRAVTLTAVDGGNIDLADIELLGVDNDDTTDITTSVSVSATGTDASDNGSTVTIAAMNTAAATLDALNITSDADGTVSVTTGAATLTITEIDATASLGEFTYVGTTLAAATEINTGSGTNIIRTEADTQDAINLAASAGTDTIRIYEAQGAGDYDQVTNFEAGADGDIIALDVSTLAQGTVAVAGESGTTLSSEVVVSIFTDADGAAVDFDPTGLGANILRVTDTYADSTALLAALSVADGADNVLDNEDLLVLWTNGSSTFLSVATGAGASWTDFDAILDLVELVAVPVTSITADNIAFI